MGVVVGDAGELVSTTAPCTGRGVDRFYVWLTDFADPATLAEFGATIISELG